MVEITITGIDSLKAYFNGMQKNVSRSKQKIPSKAAFESRRNIRQLIRSERHPRDGPYRRKMGTGALEAIQARKVKDNKRETTYIVRVDPAIADTSSDTGAKIYSPSKTIAIAETGRTKGTPARAKKYFERGLLKSIHKIDNLIVNEADKIIRGK